MYKSKLEAYTKEHEGLIAPIITYIQETITDTNAVLIQKTEAHPYNLLKALKERLDDKESEEDDDEERETDVDEDREKYGLKISEVPDKIDWGIKREELATLCGTAVAHNRTLPFRYIMILAWSSSLAGTLTADGKAIGAIGSKRTYWQNAPKSYKGTKHVRKEVNILVTQAWAERQAFVPVAMYKPPRLSHRKPGAMKALTRADIEEGRPTYWMEGSLIGKPLEFGVN